MTKRKLRLVVVIDTNVFVRAFKTTSTSNWNRRIVALWLKQRRLQLVTSPELVDEYLGIFGSVLGMASEVISEWRKRFESDDRSTLVSLGPRFTASRDPDDNVLLATAAVGQAKFLITNDRDLLDVSDEFKQAQKYHIVRPQDFLAWWDTAES
jgi:putative PIN family toxin of toxin-antitoxin system